MHGFKKIKLLNLLKRFALSGLAFLLLVSLCARPVQAADTVSSQVQVVSYTAEQLRGIPIDNLKVKVTEAEKKSASLQKEIEALAKQTRDNKGNPASQVELTKKKSALERLNSKELIPLRMELYSRSKAELGGMITIQGQGFFSDAATLLGTVIDLLIRFVGLVAFVLLVVGGLRLVTAAGNGNAIQNAKRMLTYAVVGLVVALSAYLIVTFLHGLLYR